MDIKMEPFIILECVDSTNNYAMQQIKSGAAKDGDAWLAMEQTNGKGRRGRVWEARKGDNILMSLIICTAFLPVYRQFMLSAAVSIACYNFFKSYAKNYVCIKWPNDLFWNDRKAGGILIENTIKGDIWQWSVIGLGINVNQTSFSLNSKAVSLKEITGKHFNVAILANELYAQIINKLNELKQQRFKDILNEYNEILYKKNEKARLKMQNVIFETTITGVSPLGQLQTFDSLEHSFNFDEIEWVL